MSVTATKAVHLLAELLEMDRSVRSRRQARSLPQKQRRAAIVRELHQFMLARQRGPGAEQRQFPRAAIRIKVQMLGGPHPVDLHSDSLAVGGLSCQVSFTPRNGDLFGLRLVPLEEPPLEVDAEVVWYDPVRSRVGLRFINLSDEGREILERLVLQELVNQPA
jgi:hypothetical protein